jgi:hypothetical protein
MLDKEEYVEQSHFFRVIVDRLADNVPLQDLMAQAREEILASTKLPLAIDFLLSELKHAGVLAPAMARLSHYFTPFQAFVMREAETDNRRFEFTTALEILRYEATYRAAGAEVQGMFLYQFEALCRNRLRYDHGLAAMAQDPCYDAAWREWILSVRRQIGIIDLADMIYVRSQHYETRRQSTADSHGDDEPDLQPQRIVLFGEKEGRIALANRRKDPLYLFAAMQRHLGYPAVPRRKKFDDTPYLIPQILSRLEQFETRLKIMEEEARDQFDITKFYVKPPEPEGDTNPGETP